MSDTLIRKGERRITRHGLLELRGIAKDTVKQAHSAFSVIDSLVSQSTFGGLESHLRNWRHRIEMGAASVSSRCGTIRPP
jgi:hypothetical protein